MLRGRLKAIIAVAFAIMLAAVPLVASQTGQTRRVRFPKGRNSVVLKGAAVRGTQDRYILRAGQGQTMTLRITSTEDNAVFDVVPPGGGQPLASEQMEWTGELPTTGDYTIVVGGTRGNATYSLQVTIR
ncbi:MAG TPA: hypothetical protein VJS44_13405 [Pyrinomonadaceae bacterium]|nr:hypothetical protein [Pyrinomonadaceae bacterium]